jgi:hypothetical protein
MRSQIANLRLEPDDDNAPVRTMHDLADRLTGRGFDVGGSAWDHTRRLQISNVRGALCEVSLRDDGHMSWEYRPCRGTHLDPAHVADMVMGILGAEDEQRGAYARHPGLTFKGVVGRALAGCGMTVRLVTILRDDVSYDLYAEIEVTNPARPGRGRVRVTDHATVRWECPYRIPAAAPDAAALNLGDIVDIIAAVLAQQGA